MFEEKELKEVAEQEELMAVEVENGYELRTEDRYLMPKRSKNPRLFKTLGAVGSLLKRHGIKHFSVKLL